MDTALEPVGGGVKWSSRVKGLDGEVGCYSLPMAQKAFVGLVEGRAGSLRHSLVWCRRASCSQESACSWHQRWSGSPLASCVLLVPLEFVHLRKYSIVTYRRFFFLKKNNLFKK